MGKDLPAGITYWQKKYYYFNCLPDGKQFMFPVLFIVIFYLKKHFLFIK